MSERAFGISRGPIPRKEIIAEDPLGEFLVWWDDVRSTHADAFRAALNSATREEDLQRHLEAHPMLLVQSLTGGHGRWVIPRQRLGAEFVTDFLVGERSSMGHEWLAVELESPRARMFTKSGDPSARLTHALRQITDWRAWLKNNQNYAARPRPESGLGLTGISPSLPALVLIGRRAETDEGTSARRRQMCEDLNVEIHSFDWLLDVAENRARIVDSARQSRRARSRTR